MNRRTGAVAASVVALLILVTPAGARAQSTDGNELAAASVAADVQANRAAVIQQLVDRWQPQLRPANPARNDDGGAAELNAVLQGASAEQLLAASKAETYEAALAALNGRWQGPNVLPLEPGAVIPNTLGSTSGDLVFTPITPCRIFDTRYATGDWAGKVGPNSGNWFSVNLSNFTAQGGSSSCAGMPTTFDVSAVALNLTSTGQTGTGNLRLVQCGGGTPAVSLLNYTVGVNLANAAIVRSAIGCTLGPGGSNDMYVYSTNAASDVVVDLMGYYAAPEATALENVKESATYITIASGTVGTVTSPTCPSGYRITGGGGGFVTSVAGAITMFIHPFGPDGSPFTYYNCGGWNTSGSSLSFGCSSVCSRVPGR